MSDEKVNRWGHIVRELQGWIAFLIIFCMVGGLGWLVIRSQHNAPVISHIDSVSTDTSNILNFIVDCTTPGHKCYEDGQKNTAGVIQKLEDIILLASVCSKVPGNNTVQEIKACVENGLK